MQTAHKSSGHQQYALCFLPVISTFLFSSFFRESSKPDSCMQGDDPTPCWATGRDSTNSSSLFRCCFNSFFWPPLPPRRDFKKATKSESASIDKEWDRKVTVSKYLICLELLLFLFQPFQPYSTCPLLLYQLSLLFKLRHLTALWPLEHISWVLTGEVPPEKKLMSFKVKKPQKL